MIDQGQADSLADLSRILGVSRAKITQTMNLLKLAPEVQDIMINLEKKDKRLQILTERRLRPLVQIENGAEQHKRFQKLIDDEIGTVERIRSQ